MSESVATYHRARLLDCEIRIFSHKLGYRLTLEDLTTQRVFYNQVLPISDGVSIGSGFISVLEEAENQVRKYKQENKL